MSAKTFEQVAPRLGRPRSRRWPALLLGLVLGFAGGNVSPRLVEPAWDFPGGPDRSPVLAVPGPAAPADRMAGMLARVTEEEARCRSRLVELRRERDQKRRALALMKTQGRDSHSWPRLQEQIDQLEQEVEELDRALGEVARLRTALQRLSDREPAGLSARELDDLEETVIRARRLLETQGASGP